MPDMTKNSFQLLDIIKNLENINKMVDLVFDHFACYMELFCFLSTMLGNKGTLLRGIDHLVTSNRFKGEHQKYLVATFPRHYGSVIYSYEIFIKGIKNARLATGMRAGHGS